jgi:multiple sugar transport system ATP-binding protein
MAEVRYVQATKLYTGSDVAAVDALDLEIDDGEFVVLVGPSGSGKTTALRMLAGLEEVDAGAVVIGDRDVTDLPPKKRDVAMVFQNYALYPYLTVSENIAFPLKMAKVKKAERERKAAEVAARLGLERYLDRKPAQLSGGERQRVAMGRAIIRQPKVFLMDEPLSNLDAKLRVQMRADIAALQHEFGVTTVYVTHDQAEAMTLGHRVAVLDGGELQQYGSPRELYDRPVNSFVAGFIGSPAMNLCEVPVGANGSVAFGGTRVELPHGRRGVRGGCVRLLQRRDRRGRDEARRAHRGAARAGAGRAGHAAGARRGGAPVRRRDGRTRDPTGLVAVDLDEPLVADPEVVRDLVQHDAPHLGAEQVVAPAVEALERAAEDRDLVRQRAGVVGAAARQRDALVEAEQRAPSRRLVVDHDLDVRHLPPQLGRQRVERLARVLLEPFVGVDHRTQSARRSRAVLGELAEVEPSGPGAIVGRRG